MKNIFSILAFLIVSTIHAQTATPPATDSGFYKSFDNTPIYYETSGAGKPVVLVHGFMGKGESWKKSQLYADLISLGYKVILLDLRGNGRSGKPHTDEGYNNDAEAKDIIGLLHYLHVKDYYAVGYSRGSIIVSRLLMLDKHVQRAVMGGMGTGFTDSAWPRRIMFYEALSGKDVPQLAAMVKNVQQSGLDQTALALQQKWQPFTTPKQLGTISKPVLLICGDKDEDNGAAPDLAAMIPGSKYVKVPGDHGGASRTKEFSNAVTTFLQ